MTSQEVLSNLLDTVYELEGLLHLAINRDNPPASLSTLIARKAEMIAEVTKSTEFCILAEADETSAPQTEDENQAEPMEAAADEPYEIPTETVAPGYDAVEKYTATSEVAVAPVPETPAPAPTQTPRTVAAPRRDRPRPAFSLNDRYRFRRTLFKGNDAEFSSAIARVAETPTLDEAQAWLYDQLGWDPENDEVRAFMEILENYYRQNR